MTQTPSSTTYKNMFGATNARSTFVDNIKLGVAKCDNKLRTNGQYLALPWTSSGAGTIFVHKVDQFGKVDDVPPLITAHKNVVSDFEFYPFIASLLVTSSIDGTV